MDETQENGGTQQSRPDFSNNPKMVVWNMLKRQRDQARNVDVETDLLMQAIEAAPEIERAMQVAFNLQQPANMNGPTSGPGFQVKK